jgi:arginine/lysine/ornithine decarboxylase
MMNKLNSSHLHSFLRKYAGQDPVRFHMPGHKGARLYKQYGYRDFLQNFMAYDITEIPGADDLFQPEGVLRDLGERYRKLYQCRASFPLVNGSSCGLIAAVLSAADRGSEIIIARNCHKSVYNAVELAGAEAVYVYPELVPGWGISGGTSAEEIDKAFQQHPDAAAVVITSPNYYGIQSRISSIAEAAHRHGAVLIVDQAHGAHLPFFQALKDQGEDVDFQCQSAEAQGADIVVSSLHKTMASLGQTALLNVCSERICLDDLEQALQKTQTSSPSYLLMDSMDINADLLEHHGKACIREWNKQIRRFYKEAEKIPGLEVMKDPMMDQTKLNLSMRRLGLDASQLQNALIQKGIWPEMACGDIVMCLTGMGSVWEDEEALLRALYGVSEQYRKTETSVHSDGIVDSIQTNMNNGCACIQNVRKKEQRPDFFHLKKAHRGKERKKVPIQEAEGRVCASPLIPYPPGIPTICRGEIFTEEVILYLLERKRRGEEVQGMDPGERVFVFL